MSQSSEELRVVPAQLDFLAIYNPTLGESEETLKDQIVYYHAHGERKRPKQDAKQDAKQKDATSSSAADEANERLRQIGLAQGMVAFANNFSDANIDTVETERSRIVLHELETDWWILASINLTQLPASASRSPSRDNLGKLTVEYSAREVAPAPLLIVQLIKANSSFLLHHATKLSELFDRLGRSTFCSLLERYWDKFVRNWDVLLHGNPAATIYNATRLGGGGELGIGVGEEEWGSGEREVLEGFIERTEGLRDLIVGRYGLSPDVESPSAAHKKAESAWLGSGNDPAAADGIIFSGKGVISRRSLFTISQWMEAIFKQGSDAYGIAENPSSRPRQKRQKPNLQRAASSEEFIAQDLHPRIRSLKPQTSNLRKQAFENTATSPRIPAPLVGQGTRSLTQALAKAEERSSNTATRQDKPKKEDSNLKDTNDSSGTEQMMKYLTLGYGSAWTLNPKGFKPDKVEDVTQSGQNSKSPDSVSNVENDATNDRRLQEVDPTPEVSEDEAPFKQRLEQSIGKFLIGLSGDLEQTELDAEDDDDDNNDDNGDTTESARSRPSNRRLFLRTLNIEMSEPTRQLRNTTIREDSNDSGKSNLSTSNGPPTSASASVDGSQPNFTHEKVQVTVYIHQPFIFVFLFQLHTPSLTVPSFYRSIHNQLGPLQKSLLRSTDPNRIAKRIAEAMGEKSSTSSQINPSQMGNPIYDLIYDPFKLTVRTSIPNIPIPGTLAAEGFSPDTTSSLSISGAWYTLGIPIGNTSTITTTASSTGRLVKSAWSRVDALNAHTQIMNTYIATRCGSEIEQTVKTARGWWVLWMKLPQSQAQVNKSKTRSSAEYSDSAKHATSISTAGSFTLRQERYKEAFLLRKAADFSPATSAPRSTSSGPGRWLLREQRRETSGASNTGGAASAKGVSDGVGVDARRWVEGLLTLTQ